MSLVVPAGHVADSGQVRRLYALDRTPEGQLHQKPVTRDGDGWSFALQTMIVGVHTIHIVAEDVAGNRTTVGPFTVMVTGTVEQPGWKLYLPIVLSAAGGSVAALVLSSRVLGDVAEGAMLLYQRLGNRFSAALMSRLYGVKVTDLGPYRAIRAELMRTLEMREMTFGWPTEMTVKVAKRKGRILEVPVSWHVRRSGRSKVSGTLTGSILAGYYILGVTLRYAWW